MADSSDFALPFNVLFLNCVSDNLYCSFNELTVDKDCNLASQLDNHLALGVHYHILPPQYVPFTKLICSPNIDKKVYYLLF